MVSGIKRVVLLNATLCVKVYNSNISLKISAYRLKLQEQIPNIKWPSAKATVIKIISVNKASFVCRKKRNFSLYLGAKEYQTKIGTTVLLKLRRDNIKRSRSKCLLLTFKMLFLH